MTPSETNFDALGDFASNLRFCSVLASRVRKLCLKPLTGPPTGRVLT